MSDFAHRFFLRIAVLAPGLLILGVIGVQADMVGDATVVTVEVAARADTVMAEARALIETALDKYDAEDYLSSEQDVLLAARKLYGLELPLGDGDKRYAELTSMVSLLTVRLNRLLHGASPELEPERFSMPIPYNPRIEREIDHYLTVGREEFARWLRRSGRYLPLVRRAFREEGLPEDLVYIALIESGFNPRNRSHKEAVGLFQFLMSTGEMVGLKKDFWVDERQDPHKATRGAIRHLKSLFQEFGDWDLALAAYNAGSGRVWKSIRSQGVRDFWQLALPPETESYVPKFYAALVISREPELYGFNPVLEAQEDFEEIEVPGGVDLKTVAECCGITLAAVSDLNTELTKGCTPPEDVPYLLRVPLGTADKFRTAFAALPESKKYLSQEELSRRKFKGVYMVYVVKRGDSLYAIARKCHTTVAKIRRGNPFLQGKKFLHPGQKLRIYRVQ